MTDPTRIPERQLQLGPAGFFRVSPEDPPGNQVVVSPGFVQSGGSSLADAFTGGPQTTAAFAPVSVGNKRYDLVYIDESGAALILAGSEVPVASAVFQGAPGFSAGPHMPDRAVPVALVLVDETAGVLVELDDITQLGGFYNAQRDYDGYLVDRGLFGAAPSGLSDIVTALFAADEPGGTATSKGVVTAPPLNYVTLVDQKGDEILHSTGARMYGRITEAVGVWTLSYHYLDATGTEQTMDPSTDTSGAAPTDIALIGTPIVFSRNDPARPLFQSGVARLSDQLVGTIPYATEVSPGQVQLAADLDTAAGEAVQGSDQRLGTVQVENEGGGSLGRFSRLNFIGSSVNAADGGSGVANITVSSVVLQTFTDILTPSNSNAAQNTGAVGFTPILALFFAALYGNGGLGIQAPSLSVGFARGTGIGSPPDQGSVAHLGERHSSGTADCDRVSIDNTFVAGVLEESGGLTSTAFSTNHLQVGSGNGAAAYRVTQFNAADIILTPSFVAPISTITGEVFVVVLG